MNRAAPNSKKIRLQSLRLTFSKENMQQDLLVSVLPLTPGNQDLQNPFMSTLVSNTPKCEIHNSTHSSTKSSFTYEGLEAYEMSYYYFLHLSLSKIFLLDHRKLVSKGNRW